MSKLFQIKIADRWIIKKGVIFSGTTPFFAI